MINMVLLEMKRNTAPFSVTDLSEKLNIERSALEGMLAFWVRKGRLLENGQQFVDQRAGAVCGSCGTSCSGFDNCSFVARMPKMYSVSRKNNVKDSEE